MTVCSGIGAPEIAAPFIDWRFQSEIEAFPCAVLKARFPHATNLGDMTKFKEWPDAPIDILVGGTPCQSFSVAGLRKGMADPRGNLALVYLAIADRYRPEWLLWENVPGVLSSNEGRDFGSFLGGLAELGYGFAYRVLDAQFVRVESHPWAVPQRRRRVFVVGHLGDWRRAAAVLFERESLSGHSPPRREAGKGVAGTISSRPTGGGGLGTDFDLGGGLIAPAVSPAMKARDSKGPSSDGDGDGLPLIAGTMKSMDKSGGCSNSADHAAAGYMVPVAPTLRAGGNKTGGDRPPGTDVDTVETLVAHSLKTDGFDASEDGTGRGTPIVPVTQPTHEIVGTLCAEVSPHGARGLTGLQTMLSGYIQPVVYHVIAIRDDATPKSQNDVAFTPTQPSPSGGGHPQAVAYGFQPRIARNGRGDTGDIVAALNAQSGETGKGDAAPHVVYPINTQIALRHEATGRGTGMGIGSEEDPGFTLRAGHHHAVAFVQNTRDEVRLMGGDGSITGALGAEPGMKQQTYVHQAWAVRRLTPTECERLQGFPDGHTAIEYRGKPAVDGPRYKAIGNSMAVNVMNWLLGRIYESHNRKADAA